MLKEADLMQFTGTECYYRHPLSGLRYTDGVQYLAKEAGAYWLIDAIASYGKKEPFQVWTLQLHEDDRGAVLTMQEDSDAPILVSQEIEYTDFPLKRVELWLIDGVLILPSEY